MAAERAGRSEEARAVLMENKARKDEQEKAAEEHRRTYACDDDFVAKLAGIPVRHGNKMKVPELREACLVRGLDSSGLKGDMVERLAAYTPKIFPGGSRAIVAVAPQPAERPFGTLALISGGAARALGAAADEAHGVTVSVKKQLRNYLSEPAASQTTDPLDWWRANQAKFPLLTPLARDLLAMPGSTAALERAFSHAGRIWAPRRLRTDRKLGAAILMCHENIRLGVL